MATKGRSVKQAGELLKEQAQAEAVEAAAPQEAVKPGKRPMVEANAMDVDPPAPAGKKGKPAAAKAPAGKRKAAAAAPEAPEDGAAEAKRKQQPKGKAAAKPAAAEQAAAEPEAEAAPAKKQKAAKKQPAAKKAGKATAEQPAAEPEAQQPEAAEKQAGGKKQAAKKAAAAAEAEPAAMETDGPAAAAEREPAPAKKSGKAPKRAAADAAEAEAQPRQVKTSRGRTTAGVDYRERTAAVKEQTVAVKVEATAESEAAAIAALEPAGRSFRLSDFAVFDTAGEQQPLTHAQLHTTPLYASGVVFPAEGALSKLQGQRVARLGPVVGWRLVGQEVVLKTAAAEYACVRAASGYRAVFAHLSEQAELAHEVLKALSPELGGNPAASLDEVVARLARAKVGKAYLSAREALQLNGRFVLQQLAAADAGSVTSQLGGTPFAAALAQEVAAVERGGGGNGGAIVINEPGSGAGVTDPAATLTDADRAGLDYARQVAARLDAQEARAANKRGSGAARGPAYIKISAAEIAEDYPDPAQYEKEGEETDELLLADEELFDVDPESLPRRLLKDFSIYDSEGLLSTLELLPMWGGAQPDAELFASGLVVDDDGEWAGGQAVAEPAADGAGSSSGAAGGSSSAGGGGSAAAPAAAEAEAGMRIYLSQVQEWVVEFSCDMLLISLRTDVAWYRLDRPAPAYAPWFNVVLKSARVAVKALTLLSEESRASKLSFGDVVKRLAAAEKGSATHISDKADAVERFVVVHGQILLNQFAHFPVKSVRASAFATGLKSRMELRRHAKLYLSKAKAPKARANANPMRDRACAKVKPMTATATLLVRGVWQSYFKMGAAAPKGEGEAAAEAAVEVAEDENEEDDEAAEEDALADAPPRDTPAAAADADVEIAWGGAATKRAGSDFYPRATIGGVEVAAGDVVALRGGSEIAPPLGLVQALFQAKGGKKQVQLRTVVHGRETVLGDAAADDELFVTTELATKSAGSVARKVQATRLQRAWSLAERRAHLADDAARRERNAAAAAEGRELEHICRTLYVPQEGKFAALPADLALGTLASEQQAAPPGVALSADGKALTEAGERLTPGAFVFLRPDTLDQVEGAAGEELALPDYAAKGRFCKGGANAGLRPYGVAQLLGVEPAAAGKRAKQTGAKARVRRFYRPEDVSADLAYTSDFRDLFASDEELSVDVSDIVARCRVAVAGAPADEETFVCRKTFRRSDGAFLDPPADLAPPAPAAAAKAASRADKGKGKAAASGTAAADASARQPTGVDDGISLASMDIFAGCGGLSEGFHQARAAHAKWAIEYERPAAEAFRLNHPDAVCWAENCNVILLAAMHKAGLADLCAGSEEAAAAAGALPQELRDSLPGPGEVDFLCGGPPCQGYSGMNRFNKGNWSMVQNSMVMSYLSFADFYRPRYFLLENVRNFVSHNKSFTFRLTLRSLLDMGYQVRFGVLNAGNFGVSQSRKRTFIWAAAPGERLPDWPRLQHVFHSPQLTINLPGNVKYCAVPQTEGAPLRTVTVRDVIADLPPIANGHDAAEMAYSSGPQSAFQRGVRGGEGVLRDHLCKEMNALNLERCRCIPKGQPGADWRVLEQIVKEDPSRERFQGQPLVPWCLPHTAHRHNGWRGLFGRLAWGGHFPTSTTDPQPMGKVGQVFHPDQDRIVSVRECARAQGFPDSFRFYGTVHNKHRQIGNAVPPPLAAALGRRLRQALEATAAERQDGLLQAQLAALA